MTEINLNNFIELNNDKIDSTGISKQFKKNEYKFLQGLWPAEEALAFFCIENFEKYFK